MSVLGDVVGVLCGSWLSDDFFFEVESQGLLMGLGLRGAPHWVTRGTHPRVFLTCLNNVTRTDGGVCG